MIKDLHTILFNFCFAILNCLNAYKEKTQKHRAKTRQKKLKKKAVLPRLGPAVDKVFAIKNTTRPDD
ncbi:MAG: hypothetical protein AB7O73_06585, partial [Bacteroidia bacterium]